MLDCMHVLHERTRSYCWLIIGCPFSAKSVACLYWNKNLYIADNMALPPICQFAKDFHELQWKVIRLNGMYGQTDRLVPLDSKLNEANERHIVRVCTPEHAQAIAETGTIPVLPCPGVHPSILSGVRLCRNGFRTGLVEKLKQIRVLDPAFPNMKRPYPVPGTCSFTSPSNFAKVYRTFCNRLAEKEWKGSGVVWVILDTEKLGEIGIGNFRTQEEASALVNDLKQLLPQDFDLMESWKDEILETSASLMESHLYQSIPIDDLMDIDAASILFFGMSAPDVKHRLSMAAYRKIVEKQGGWGCNPSVQQHSDILYPALADALEKVAYYGPYFEKAMKVIKLSVELEEQSSLYYSSLRQSRIPCRCQICLYFWLRSLVVRCVQKRRHSCAMIALMFFVFFKRLSKKRCLENWRIF